MNKIPLDEFLEDIRQQKREGRRKRERKIEEPAKEPWEVHPEALSRGDYDYLTKHGRHRLGRPRPVWLTNKNRWTVGAPVNPIEWQILIRSDPRSERVTKRDVGDAMAGTCDWFTMHDHTFSKCFSRLHDRRLLKKFGRSRIVDKWLFPDLTGSRAGGEWHQDRIHHFIDVLSREFGCFTYADRGYCPGVEMPDVITVRPQLVKHTVLYDTCKEPLRWDFENPIYAEFKSARDMRRHPARLGRQLDRYGSAPLYLEVEARVGEARDMIEERGRREVDFSDLVRSPGDGMVYLHGSERTEAEMSFEPVLERIREAFRGTYDRKARLKKTGKDPRGRERYSLILYDSVGTAKNIGQVIPDYAVDVWDFADRFFGRKRLGRIATVDYIYTPERKPTDENKTWKWKKKKTKGFKFRSFSNPH